MEKLKTSMIVLLVICLIVGGSITTFVLLRTFGWLQRAEQTVSEEVDPAELLRKYEWFKDVAAQLDKKRADISVFETKMKDLETSYNDIPRTDWDRTDKETYNQWSQELAGVKASYNGLAAEYNAQMAKINWRFCNKGSLPKGATEILPREFRQYQTE